ncbi:peptide deformylase [Prosthecochloris sp. SCSIO W1101]|uniref:peptide deformylase n=1 Tax=Prosthecochloris sp. SCSIO W1101 TaxID=2992242 RepID=UPI00223D77BE|nr:peptide deformylase [Prosthecochloris sp. SCSIO W1101]UZJ40526.1 peptide deformylase [Prosthecochloris sp. SCSIO W1101]
MILPINTYSDQVLRRKTKPLKGVDEQLEDLIGNMFESMRNADGIGLAAPQVGASLRLLVVDISIAEGYEKASPMVVINPHILAVKGFVSMNEGCLSIPDVRGDVVRPSSIQIKYRDEHFEEHTAEFNDLTARVLQHEVDHLDGTLFVDRMQRRSRRKIQKELDAITRGEVMTSYPIATQTLDCEAK